MRLIMIAAFGLTIALAGCKSTTPPVEAVKKTAEKPPNDVGDHMIDRSDVVWKTYDCAAKTELPFVAIEDQRTEPEQVAAGESFAHYFVYAACPGADNRLVSGKLTRKIFFKGRLVGTTTKHIDLKAGRWGVRIIMQVPPRAKPGSYEFKLTFAADPVKPSRKRYSVDKSTAFEVLPEADPNGLQTADPRTVPSME